MALSVQGTKNMDLSEFITTTLTSIQKGVTDANSQTDGTYNVVANNQVVNFDVAVTVSKETAKGGKGGLQIHIVEASLGANTKKEESNVSRINFTVGVKKTIQ